MLYNKEKRVLIVPKLEYGRAIRRAKNTKILTAELLRATGKKHPVLQLLRNEKIKKVSVCGGFPYDLACILQKGGVKVQILKTAPFVKRERKTTDEIRKMRETQQAAVIAMRSAISMIAHTTITSDRHLLFQKKIMTSESIRFAIMRMLLDHKCSGKEVVVACGKQAADPHEPGYGPLYANEPIVLDIFPRHMEHGYWGDMTRTVVRGKASPEIKNMYYAVKAAYNAALTRVKPGVCYKTIHQAAFDEIAQRGFITQEKDGRPEGFFHGTGHGVGLAIHEAPGVSKGNKQRLQSGHVITIEPGLYYPEIGGIRIEDTIIVTPGGWRYLVPCEKRFEI